MAKAGGERGWGRLPAGLMVLGVLGAAGLIGAASLNFGDPGLDLELRTARAAASELAWAERSVERLLAESDFFGPSDGDWVHMPALSADSSHTASEERAGELRGTQAASVFSTLHRSALSMAVEGDRSGALAQIREALSLHGDGAPRGLLAKARLRELVWAHAEGDLEGARAVGQILLGELGGEQLAGVPVAVLAALGGPPDSSVLGEVFRRLEAGEWTYVPGRAAVEFGQGRLSVHPDPTDAVLLEQLRARAPDWDWSRALGLDRTRTAALLEALPELAQTPEGRWSLLPWPGEPASPWCLAAYFDGSERVLLALSRQRLAEIVGGRLLGPSGEGPDTSGEGLRVRLAAVEGDLDGDVGRVAGPTVLSNVGLAADVVAPALAQQVASERDRLWAFRLGLVGLGVLVFVAAGLSAKGLVRERRLAHLRSTFVAAVSHDLRTPLASILLLLENLQRGSVATDVARARYHGAMRQEAERLLRMVEDLLDVSRIERGSGPRVVLEAVAMESFWSELEQALAARAEQVGAEFSFTRGALPKTWPLDGDGVRRAVWNLVENALRHGRGPNGSVRVEVEVQGTEQELWVEVRDRGPGIAARYRERVFAPFARGLGVRPSGSAMDDIGTGLGLAIVRAIAEAHGGSACVLPSEQGARLRFAVSKPSSPEGGSAA